MVQTTIMEVFKKVYPPSPSTLSKFRPPGFNALIFGAFSFDETSTSCKIVIVKPTKELLKSANDCVFSSLSQRILLETPPSC